MYVYLENRLLKPNIIRIYSLKFTKANLFAKIIVVTINQNNSKVKRTTQYKNIY